MELLIMTAAHFKIHVEKEWGTVIMMAIVSEDSNVGSITVGLCLE